MRTYTLGGIVKNPNQSRDLIPEHLPAGNIFPAAEPKKFKKKNFLKVNRNIYMGTGTVSKLKVLITVIETLTSNVNTSNTHTAPSKKSNRDFSFLPVNSVHLTVKNRSLFKSKNLFF